MFSTLLLLSSILGLLIGSFLNVLIYRYGTGQSVAYGRSQCLNCGKELLWHELIPVFSFLVQKGKCRGCGSKISFQYPIIELISAALFALVFIRQYNLYSLYSLFSHGLLYYSLLLLFYFFTAGLLLVIAVYDLKHKIIPNSLVYWFIGLSVVKLILFLFIFPGVSPLKFPYFFDLLAPIILFTPFALLWFISGGRWIGFGDAKLAFGIGAMLGFVSGLSAVVLGFWIGAAICIILIAAQKFYSRRRVSEMRKEYLSHFRAEDGDIRDENISYSGFTELNRKSEIPLGPFLILGVFIVLFFHLDVLGIAAFFIA